MHLIQLMKSVSSQAHLGCLKIIGQLLLTLKWNHLERKSEDLSAIFEHRGACAAQAREKLGGPTAPRTPPHIYKKGYVAAPTSLT